MNDSGNILWIPIIVISVLSILKLMNKNKSNGKPWIRIEKVEENE
ncbi:MAG: hypothetical protein ACJZ1Q_08060 [Candidatus Neomarinimicrobiota bacterium]|tara:strand:+ start:912 stop:1046 length:135 start_codon:yes stop_codon:yes gene_type:complete